VVNSDYFTLINPDDGGLKANMSCPGVTLPGCMCPAFVRLQVTDSMKAQINKQTSGTTTNGISKATLGAAIGGTAAGLLALFVGLLFLAKKMGWIISASDCRALISELKAHLTENMEQKSTGWDYNQTNQLAGEGIHQMP
jgi:hypothetical protein